MCCSSPVLGRVVAGWMPLIEDHFFHFIGDVFRFVEALFENRRIGRTPSPIEFNEILLSAGIIVVVAAAVAAESIIMAGFVDVIPSIT